MYRAPFFRGQMLTQRDLWPDVEINDITDMANGMMFSPVPANRHDYKSIGVVADPGAGKTQLAIYLAYLAFTAYGAVNINIVYGKDVNECLNRLDARAVQFIIVDDASGAQNSRKAYENIDAVQNVLTARHKAKRHQEGITDETGGIVFLVWVWQYFTTLERVFRKVQYAFLKTYEDESHADYRRLLGGYGDILRRNTLRINKGDQEAKGYSLCAIPSMFMDGNRYAGRGSYQSVQVSPHEFPAFPWSSLNGQVAPPINPVDERLKDVDPNKLFRAREIAIMLTKPGMTQAKSGELWKMDQYEVSRLMKWYRDLGGVTDVID